MSGKSTRNEFEIVNAYITADRYPESKLDKNKINIKNSITQLNIYEDLDYSYLRGEILFIDHYGFNSIFKIKGTERLELSVKSYTNEVFTKNFIITNIAEQSKTDNKSEVLLLNIIEEFAYFGGLENVSKCYKGTPYDIIRNIYEEILPDNTINDQYTSDIFKNSSSDLQMKYIAPNIPRIQAVERIKERIYTETNAPFFLYSSLISDNINLSDLDYLLKNKPLSQKYTYSQTQADQDANPLFHIKTFDMENIPSTFNLLKAGLLNSTLNVFDITSGGHFNYKHRLRDTIENIYKESSNIKDDDFIFDEKLINNINQKTISDLITHEHSIVVASDAFIDNDGQQFYGYHEEKQQENKHLGKLGTRAVRNLLDTNRYTISIPGAPLLNKKLNSVIGHKILIDYYHRVGGEKLTVVKSKEMSGEFLIYRAKHTMADKFYTLVLDVVKLKNVDNIPTISLSKGGGGGK